MQLQTVVASILLATTATFCAGADPIVPATQPLSQASPEAADARTKYEATIRQLKEDFLSKVSAEHLKYTKRLELLMADATKRGKLEAAISIRYELANEKDKTPSEVVDAVTPRPAANQNPVPPTPSTLSGRYLIRWSFDANGIRYVFKDGMVLESTGNMSAPFIQRNGVMTVTWPNGNTDTFFVVSNVLFAESRRAGVRPDQPPTGFGRGEKISPE